MLQAEAVLQPMKMEHIDVSEKSAYKVQTPGNYLEESIQNFNNVFHLPVGL